MQDFKYKPNIEDIKSEYLEWAENILKVRFDLKPEAKDPHHKNNYSYENAAHCFWNKISGDIENLLWLDWEGRQSIEQDTAAKLLDEFATALITLKLGPVIQPEKIKDNPISEGAYLFLLEQIKSLAETYNVEYSKKALETRILGKTEPKDKDKDAKKVKQKAKVLDETIEDIIENREALLDFISNLMDRYADLEAKYLKLVNSKNVVLGVDLANED
jgi:hypothetical protein